MVTVRCQVGKDNGICHGKMAVNNGEIACQSAHDQEGTNENKKERMWQAEG